MDRSPHHLLVKQEGISFSFAVRMDEKTVGLFSGGGPGKERKGKERKGKDRKGKMVRTELG